MFTERVNALFELLGATNAEIAKFAGCDRSLISRLKNGNRTPKPSSNSTAKLIDGIYMFADEKSEIDKLLSAISCSSKNPTSDIIKEHILLYLYEGYSEYPQSAQQHKKKSETEFIRFYETKMAYGTKLNAVINIADISNVRLSKMLHIDASTISRFRKGLRIPKANRQLTNDICNVLFERIWKLGRISELLKIAGIPTDLSDDKEECYLRFCDWLCDFKEEDTNSFVENLLDNISTFSADIKTPLPGFNEAVPTKILQDKGTVYFGTDGIRTAVLRFLGNVIKNKTKELLLYSDQNMDWMTHDIAFLLKWQALMRDCVKNGVRIKIIHNINRNLDEMTNAINSWMPIYMSGMIEPYYCKKHSESNFSNTIFLCPGMACISSVHALGCEDKGIYRYDTDENVLKVHEIYYKKLLSMSKPLVNIYREQNNPIHSDGNGITAILGTLSLATMPKTLIKSIIRRNGLDETSARKILSEWGTKSQFLSDELKNGFVHECICPAEDEALFNGKIPIDIQSAYLTYNPQEYKEHIKNVIALSENHPNYRFYALPDTPFTNADLVVSEKSAAVTRLLPPQTTFVFSHPSMCEAFSGYVNHLKEQYKQDKITTKRLLERYI